MSDEVKLEDGLMLIEQIRRQHEAEIAALREQLAVAQEAVRTSHAREKKIIDEWDVMEEKLAVSQATVKRLKTMSTVEMMCENELVRLHIIEWENRCLTAEAEARRMLVALEVVSSAIGHYHQASCASYTFASAEQNYKKCTCFIGIIEAALKPEVTK